MKSINNIKKIIVLGAGESGVGSALLAVSKGYDVFVSDFGKIQGKYKTELTFNNIAFEEKQHSLDRILGADLVIKSPGIPDSVPIIQSIKENSIPIVSEIEFAVKYTNATIIGITGSNGKTTTTMLTGHVLSSEKDKVTMAGNIGDSFAKSVLDSNTDTYVLELSSFQLDGVFDFNPHIAVLTNLSPDHLDRYNYDYDQYVAAKFRLVMNQTSSDYFIYDADDHKIQEFLSKNPVKSNCVPFSLKQELNEGVYIKNNEIIMSFFNEEEPLMSADELALKGKHNAKNAMAAATVAKLIGIRKQGIRESLSNFKGVEHRLEKVLTIAHVQYINDSKATNVNATYYALEAVKKPIIWIVGGVDKGNDYSELYELVNQNVKAIICLGVDNSKLVQAFSGCTSILKETESMDEAVKLAYDISEKGDSVLLSPCCASFDLFENYEDRGRKFKEAVRKL